MNCEECGRKITKGYEWNGRTLGQKCYKNANPYYSDPAQAVFVAAKAFLAGDNGPARLLPGDWLRTMKKTRRNAAEHVAIYGGQPAYWLALLSHNRLARQNASPIKCVGDFARFK